MIKQLILISTFILCSTIQSYSQDKVLLMNGQDLECKIVADTGTVLVVDITRKKGKVKRHEVHKSEIFSITKAGQPEQVFYAKDEMLGDIFEVAEMRVYLAGEKDARENYSALPTFIAGFVLCGAVAYWGEDGYFTALIPPVAYTVFQLIPKIKIREKTMSDKGYKYNDFYLYGYEPPARSRKLIRGMQGGFGGSAAGVVLWMLLHKK
jgi:hypothetical protein